MTQPNDSIGGSMEFNIAEVFEAISEAIPDREAVVWRDQRITYGRLAERGHRLANGNEYLEGMLGAFRARVAPLNVNYRYVAEELEYLLTNSQAKASVYHAE